MYIKKEKETNYVRKTSRHNDYITNKDLHYHIVVSKAMGKLTPEATQMFILMTNRISRRFYYKDPEDRLDCVQWALMNLFTQWYNYNEEAGGNAFAYYTEIIKRGMAKGWEQVNYNRDMTISINGMYEDGNDLDI